MSPQYFLQFCDKHDVNFKLTLFKRKQDTIFNPSCKLSETEKLEVIKTIGTVKIIWNWDNKDEETMNSEQLYHFVDHGFYVLEIVDYWGNSDDMNDCHYYEFDPKTGKKTKLWVYF